MPAPREREAVLRVTSAVEDLARLYPWLDEVAGSAVPASILPGMHVVLEEAVANVARHGFPRGETGEITVRFHTGPDEVVLVVEDAGVAFDPATAPLPKRPTSLLDATQGGWGLGLIRHYCSDIAYERRDGRNRLTLRFPAPA